MDNNSPSAEQKSAAAKAKTKTNWPKLRRNGLWLLLFLVLLVPAALALWWNYQQLRVSSAKTRLAVVQKLADNRDPDAAGPLIFALQDKDAEVHT